MERITKKDIYKSYGIEFNGSKYRVPEYGFIKPLLKNNNRKLGKEVFSFSTLPANKAHIVFINGKECKVNGTCPCNCVGCYAQRGCYNFSGVKSSNAIATLLAYKHRDFLKRALIAQIKADHIKYVRIHASGDFFSIGYVNMWREIVMECKDTVFWTYTKNEKAEAAFDEFTNGNIVKSLIPGIGVNYGHCDYVIDAYNYLKNNGESVYICRCGIDDNQKCSNCKGCSINKYVLFLEHSTAYKAKEDARYSEITALIESQKTPAQAANIIAMTTWTMNSTI